MDPLARLTEQHFLVNKNDGLQILRAIAAFLVVYAHGIDVIAAHGTPKQIGFYYLANFGACGVDIFFPISGFILSTVTSAPDRICPIKQLISSCGSLSGSFPFTG